MDNKVKPLKKFGQNFLRDQNIIKKIISAINPLMDDNFLEIGPGQGAITEHLYKKVKKLYAVEIDTRVIENLRERFPEIEIINKDILKTNLVELLNIESKIRVAGNIPYNITSPILFKLLDMRNLVQDAHLMVQLEVAQRIIAKPGSKDYGILGVLMNFFATTKICFKISPNVFYPKPKVHSAIIKIEYNKEISDDFDINHFILVVKSAFANRRKTLKNSLQNGIFKECNLISSPIDLSRRAETLNQKEFLILSDFLRKEFYG